MKFCTKDDTIYRKLYIFYKAGDYNGDNRDCHEAYVTLTRRIRRANCAMVVESLLMEMNLTFGL